MQLINLFLALLLPLLALAEDTTVATYTSTSTVYHTIHVSEVSTVTYTSTSSSSRAPNTTSTFVQVPTYVPTLSANSTSTPVMTPIGTGGGGGYVIPTTTTGTSPVATPNAAPAFSGSNVGLVGFIAVAVAALL